MKVADPWNCMQGSSIELEHDYCSNECTNENGSNCYEYWLESTHSAWFTAWWCRLLHSFTTRQQVILTLCSWHCICVSIDSWCSPFIHLTVDILWWCFAANWMFWWFIWWHYRSVAGVRNLDSSFFWYWWVETKSIGTSVNAVVKAVWTWHMTSTDVYTMTVAQQIMIKTKIRM